MDSSMEEGEYVKKSWVPRKAPTELLGIQLSPNLQTIFNSNNIIIETDIMQFPGGFDSYAKSVSYNRSQSIVVNEIPGSNSGVIHAMGLNTLKFTITGTLRSPYQFDAIKVKDFIEWNILEPAEPVYIINKIYRGRCILESMDVDLQSGDQEKIPIKMTFVEYRNPNISKNQYVLAVNYGPYSVITDRLDALNIKG